MVDEPISRMMVVITDVCYSIRDFKLFNFVDVIFAFDIDTNGDNTTVTHKYVCRYVFPCFAIARIELSMLNLINTRVHYEGCRSLIMLCSDMISSTKKRESNADIFSGRDIIR